VEQRNGLVERPVVVGIAKVRGGQRKEKHLVIVVLSKVDRLIFKKEGRIVCDFQKDN
jgi:hypothetical protein